mgnify:CR=1 FL=1
MSPARAGHTGRVDLTDDVLSVAPALLGAHLCVNGVTLRLTEDLGRAAAAAAPQRATA